MIENISQFFTENWEKLTKLFTDNQGTEGNLPTWLINEVTFVILLISTIYALYRIIKKSIQSYFSWKIKKRLYKDLSYSSFSKSDVEKATQYYIPTKYQNVSPSDDEEPGSKYIASAKNELIPLFLKKAFPIYGNDNKYYLILADAGMGKTTFMINLYLAYKRKKRKFWQPPKLNIKLYSLGDPRTLDRIKQLERKNETILLLDAFDEDSEAIIDYKERMANILNEVDDFHDIVITSRTQFFPSEIEEPYSTGYISFGDSNIRRNFQKLYISVFSHKDIKKYLRKRIPIYQIKKYYRALEITRKSPSLVVRPMLLSHIDDLSSPKENYHYTYEIYQVLIEKWLIREASKPGIESKYGKGKYEVLLKKFSEDLAVDMYLNRKERGGYYATINSEILNRSELSIKDLEVDLLSDTERRSRSLLNRDAEGNYKFSHKSIMEYFLAKKIVEDEEFSKNFEFKGNDAALLFHREMLLNEVLSPVYNLFNDKITKNCGQNNYRSKLKFKQKQYSIQQSLIYHEKYKNVYNDIYNQEIIIRSGLSHFDFLYKLLLFNVAVRKIADELNRNSINTNELIYYLNSVELNELEKNLITLEKFYFETKKINNTNALIKKSIIREEPIDSKKLLKVESFLVFPINEIFSLLENLLFITRSDKKSKLFIDNQARLIEVLKKPKNKIVKNNIEFLIGLSFDLFAKRFIGDVFPYSFKIPKLDKLDPVLLQPSIILLRIFKSLKTKF